MVQPFVSYGTKEDMQDDTYKLIAIHLSHCLDAQMNKDVEKLYNHVKALFTLIHNRVKDSDTLKKDIHNVRDRLYTRNNLTTGELNLLFDNVDDILLRLTVILDDNHILFRMRSDYENLLSRGGALH